MHLPKYVYRVKNCPDIKNTSQWTRGSKRLNCLHDLNSTENGNVYHCLASFFRNETVEFCGKSRYVTAGYCPVYNYTYEVTREPDVYNCDTFISGCPTQSFHSKDVRKYSACIKINQAFGCFVEERNCPKESTYLRITNAINDMKTETSPTMLPISPNSYATHTKHSLYVDVMIIIGILLFGIIIEIYLINAYTDIIKTKTDEKFSEFLIQFDHCINEGTWQSMRTILHGIVDDGCFEKKNGTRILFKMSELFKLEYNLAFLEWLFVKCKKQDLVEKCKEFSAENQFQLKCFETKFTPRTGHQHLQFKIMMYEKESVTSNVHDLRLWLAKTTSAHPGEILLTALNIKSVLVTVTFMMKDRYANTFLKYVKTNDGLSDMVRKRVKSLNVGRIAEKSLDESNLNSRLKNATSTNFQNESSVIYTKYVQSDPEDSGIYLSETNLNSSLKHANSKRLRKKKRQIFTRTVQSDPEDNEAATSSLNLSRKKRRRTRRPVGVIKKG